MLFLNVERNLWFCLWFCFFAFYLFFFVFFRWISTQFYDLTDTKKKSHLGKVILVSKKSSTPPLFEALSTEYHERLVLGEIKPSEQALIDELKVTSTPAVLIYPKDANEPIKYDGILF